MKYLDTLFDIIVYLLIATCFITGAVIIVQHYQSGIWDAVIMIVLGLILSYFLFYLKSLTNGK